MMRGIKKAVFPVAGLGTRFLPATKSIPKEMLPIVDKPLIQYAVDEAIAAGINELIFITNHSKHAINDYFQTNYELDSVLTQRNQLDLLKIIHDILPSGVTCSFVEQDECLGLGHAILCAKELVGEEPFAVLLADDLIYEGSTGCLHAMVSLFNTTQSSILAVEEVPDIDIKRYGIVALQDESQTRHRITQIVEKPEPENAPSNWGVVGRYILPSSIFKAIETVVPDKNGEIQLTDAIAHLLSKESFYAYHLKGTRYDCGSKFGYLKATVDYALHHPELAQRFYEHLKRLSATL